MNDNWWAIASLVLSLAFTGLGWRLLASGRRFLYAHLWMACLFALQTGALCVKAYQTGMCPIRGASEVLFFLSWTINLFYLLLGRAYRMSVLGIFTAPAIAVLTALSLLIGLYGADVQGTHDFWVTAHVGVAMMSYGAGGLAAAAGVAFCMQNECLKRRQIPGTCRLLPPIRTLEASMKRLVLVAFLLLLAGEWLGWQRHLPINGAKTSIVILLTLGYSILLWFIYRRGMPGRAPGLLLCGPLYCIHEHFPGKLMRMVCLGLNHRTAPVEIRERFAVPSHRLQEEGRRIRSLPDVDQCVVLSTCNRMEIYYWSDRPESAQEHILSHFLGAGRGNVDMASHFYSHLGADALEHLCRVLSGLDSMVLGETEIFGQVKTAYQMALDAGVTAACANKTFQKAFTIGKRVRTDSQIHAGATSVGSVAVELAEQIFGDLSGTRVLILGAGEMSRVTGRALHARGAEGIYVANRSFDRAVELAGMIGGQAIRYDVWGDYLRDIDVVVAATAAPPLHHHPGDAAAAARAPQVPLPLPD